MTRDETLSAQIREALHEDDRVSDQSIYVQSRCGIVTLRGCSPSRGEMLAAIEIAASFPTCRGVVNRQVLNGMRQSSHGYLRTMSPCEPRASYAW
jgi:osmotically-inducible protein OsmY